MSLEKAIQHGKERRKRYYGSEAFDHSCRPHGGCSYCESNRKFSTMKAQIKADKTEQENEFFGLLPDPEDALMSVEEELIDEMGWDNYLELDKYTAEDWSMQ